MSKNYDGWIIKSIYWKIPFLWTFAETRTETIKKLEFNYGRGEWRKRKRRGSFKIVKVKLVEVE